MAVPDKTDSRPRQRIGRYLVTGRIGKGGMGMVYRCFDEALERELAVKTLNVQGTLDEESHKRFQIEAKAAARLQHPNIVTVFERGEDRGMPFIAMELLQGVDLENLVRSGEKLPLREKLDIVIQVCRGLAYAHERGIVHRDIKPSNICLLDDGTAKIMDFGIAKLEGTHLTKTGMMLGTIHYMSPEQVRGRTLDGRSDVFSLGVILYELLSGQRPFKGEGATDVLYKIINSPAPPLDPAVAGLHPRLQEILDRALAKEPSERYPSAARLADDLAGVVEVEKSAAAASESGPELAETVKVSRRLVKEGRIEEGLKRLQALADEHPGSLEVRRALRTAARDAQRLRKPPQSEAQTFPELEATYQAAPTQRAAETELQPTALLREEGARPGPAPRRALGWALGLGAAAMLAATAAFLLHRSSGPPPAEARIRVRSQPPGAAVLADGKDTGVVTDGELVLPAPTPPQIVLTFRKSGMREEQRSVKLPLAGGEAVAVTLVPATATVPVVSEPPGATVGLDGQRLKGATPLEVSLDPALEHRLTVALDGYAAQEVKLAPGPAPSEVRVKLEPMGPLGTVTVASVYPLDVIWRGKILAKDAVAPKVSLPGGRQALTLASAAHFLRTEITVTVAPGGETVAEAPGLGKINIRANPDNCRIFIDGAFVDYPPILDKPVAAGTHIVSFAWPDGAKTQETAEVVRGGAAYVTGRKD